MYADSVRSEIDNTYTIHKFFVYFFPNLDTHINSNYLVTLLMNLLTKLGLNLSRIKPLIIKKIIHRGRKTFSIDKDNNSEGHLASVIRHSCL